MFHFTYLFNHLFVDSTYSCAINERQFTYLVDIDTKDKFAYFGIFGLSKDNLP